jgi:lysosomal alpha-mannosidase
LNANQKENPNYYTISGNYYPVDSAIAMRDEEKKIQVTIMNDRPQGGSADLTEAASIELVQERRLLSGDNLGINGVENVNEFDLDGKGHQVNCSYKMHIFNFEKGESLQR